MRCVRQLREDLAQEPLASLLQGKLELLQDEFIDLPSDLQAWVMKVRACGCCS